MATREYIDITKGPDRPTLFDAYETQFDGPRAMHPTFAGMFNADLEDGSKRGAEAVTFDAEIVTCNHADNSGSHIAVTAIARGGRFDGRAMTFVYDTKARTACVEVVSR